jgi:hypothetical protein
MPTDNADELQTIADAKKTATGAEGSPDNPVEGHAGTATANGNAALTTFTITHTANRGKAPTQVLLTPKNAVSAAAHWPSTYTSTTFVINFSAAPASGTGNVTFDYLLVFAD